MKKIIIILVIASAISFLAYHFISNQEPHFEIENWDYLKRKGTFKFGGVENEISYGESMGISGNKHYMLNVESVGNKVLFKLYKDGKFVRLLETK